MNWPEFCSRSTHNKSNHKYKGTHLLHDFLNDLLHFRHSEHMPLSRVFWAFLGSSVVKNSPANAGHTGSILHTRWSHKPQSNKAQGSQLLSLCSRREATARASPGTTTREQPRFAVTREKLAQQQRPSTAKNLKHFKKSIFYWISSIWKGCQSQVPSANTSIRFIPRGQTIPK